MLNVTVAGAPVPLQRVRWAHGRPVSDARSMAWERTVAIAVRAAAAKAGWNSSKTHTFQVCMLIRRARKAGDGDNFEKGILDGITKSQAVWFDDRQVSAVSWELIDGEIPGLVLTIQRATPC